MGVYFCGEKVKLHHNGVACLWHMLTKTPDVTGVGLLTCDGFGLKDSYGRYLIPYGQPTSTSGVQLLSLDSRILKDFNGSYLTAREDATL